MTADLLTIFINNKCLINTTSEYLSINDLYNISKINLNAYKTINSCNMLLQLSSLEIIDKILQLIKKDKSNINFINNILNNNKNNCVNGTLHPFVINDKQKQSCNSIIETTNTYDEYKAIYLKKRNYYLYQLFKLPIFLKYNHIFKHKNICFYFTLYLPFANNGLTNDYLYIYNIYTIKNRISKMNINSSTLYNIHNKIWQCFNLTFTYNTIDIYPVLQTSLNFEPTLLISYFEKVFGFNNWKNLINWEHFFIAGDAILAAILTNDTVTKIKSIKILSLQLTNEEFMIHIIDVITKLKNAKYHF